MDSSVATGISVSVRPFVSVARLSGRIDLAISSRVLALSSFMRVFETQYQVLPDRNATRWRLRPS